MLALDKFSKVQDQVNLLNKNTKIIVVCKNQSKEKIIPLLDYGHKDFAENRVQEGKVKWSELKEKYPNINLHLIGKLQSNKVLDAILNFSYIHSLDSKKLANEIYKIQNSRGLSRDYFIQVNVGTEVQKSGISIDESSDFIDYCKDDLKLNVIGLMCIPPINKDPEYFFKILASIAKLKKLSHLSMGMSSDYMQAVKCGATYVRIGSFIFS